jgi:hypothetical protein
MRLIELSERVAQGSKNGSGRGVTIWRAQAGSVGLCPRVFDRRSRNRDRAASSVRRICSWGLTPGASFSPLNIIRSWRRISNTKASATKASARPARTGPPLADGCIPFWTHKWCAHAFKQARGSSGAWYAMELTELLPHVARELNINWDGALRYAGLNAEF